MKSAIAISIVVSLFVPTVTLASLHYPERIVNEATRECSVFYPGDECVACQVPQGWTLLPSGTGHQCPQGYREIEIQPVCHPQKNPFCCTQGHSGAPGNCEDLVINDEMKKCGFVEDIKKCSILPKGWHRPQRGDNCPLSGYGWMNQTIGCK